ncbi:acetylserotonin o-methyltransferase [Quercus suber]|uniref:Acetylserotonin o-methyltransferase n=1 Tax=Quercus suber TaxID=58331 RepID=A0AAW0LD84_QUESU
MEKTQREAKWNEEEQADVDIWKYILGFTEMAVVRCAIELGIPDTIESHGSPMTLSELSSTLGCAPSPLYRIMRFLMHRGIFKGTLNSQGSPGYAQTPLSRRLIKHGEHSMAALILLESSPVLLTPWLSLSARVLDDDTSSFEWILHDWGDNECIQILKKCREAVLENKGKVIIVDAVIEEAEIDELTDVRLALDMAMMAHTNKGKERTLKEWGFVLGEAGFSRYTMKTIHAVQSVIEAFP